MNVDEYYQDVNVLTSILNSVERPGWKVWKVQKLDGSFVNNTKKINTVKKLRELLGKSVDKVFVSVTQFLNPERVYGKRIKKSVWKAADNIIIKSDLLFDIDCKEDLSIAHEDGKTILKHMESEPDYELINIRFSGNKGFHLLYRDKHTTDVQYRREQLVKRLPYLCTIDETHKKIICDIYRVHAALGTVKASTGYKVQEISLEDFTSKSTSELLQSLARPIRPMTETSSHNVLEPVERTRVSSRFFYNFITNRVPGTDRFVPVLKYDIHKDVTKLVTGIQKRYNLGTLYKIVYQDIQMYISLKIVDYRRLVKIMKASKCLGLNSLMYYGLAWVPYGVFKFEDGKDAFPESTLKQVLSSVTRGEFSQSHYNLIKDMYGIKEDNSVNYIGDAINEIGLASEVY